MMQYHKQSRIEQIIAVQLKKLLFEMIEGLCSVNSFLLSNQIMNILSTQQMKQIQEQLLKVTLSPLFQLKSAKANPTHTLDPANINILPQASQSTQLQIRKIVSLADNMSSLTLSDANSTLKIFTISILSILYKGKYHGNQSSDNTLLEAIKCSLFSPDVNLMVIKGIPASFNSSQMKVLAAKFFQFMLKQQQNFASQAFNTSQILLQDNEHLLNCFILFFRCILLALDVEGAGNWKGKLNQKESLQNLLDYFDLGYRQIGDLFLLYEQGLFISINQKQIVYGQYFENQAQKQNQKKQMQIKSSIKMNMIESFLLNVHDERPSKKKSGIVDSDLKLFNFMLESQEEEKLAHHQNDKEVQTPHFKDNQQFHFGKKKKEQTLYKPQEVRFEFQKLIKDESMEQIEPNDLINFNAQFEQQQAPTPFLGGQFNFTKQENKPTPSLHQRSLSNQISLDHNTVPKNRMSLVDHSNAFTNSISNPQNRTKKATTQICSNQNNINANSSHYHSCICRQVRLKRNVCTSKVVQVTFIPDTKKQYYNVSLSSKNINFKAPNPRTMTEGKSYTLNKQSTIKQKKSAEDRTPSFLKNMKKQNSNNSNHPLRVQKQSEESIPQPSSNQQTYAQSAREIGKRQKANLITDNDIKKKSTILQGESNRPKFRDDQGLAKMKLSDNPQISTKKIELPGRGMAGNSNSNWQTSSNFHQRNVISTSPINQAKSTFIGQPSPQSKNISPLKFFAPVQIIAPTVYLNSNGNENNNNIVFKLSELHQNSPKILRGQHQSPYINKIQPNAKSDNNPNYNQIGK